MGHYIISMEYTLMSTLHTNMIQIPVHENFYPDHWQTSVHTILEKQHGYPI